MANHAPGGKPHTHLVEFPEALEALFARMGELTVVLGPAAAPRVDEVARLLREGLAARDRGDVPVAVARLGAAMDRLAALGSETDAAEGALMRAVAERFRHALAHGALGDARETADTMRARSGSVLHPKKGG
ncbi:MAG TPA: hypothetical protein VFD84_06925 [Candidatus Binatia bacterium]|jgi:hypothetical protein|nr:hypothetical protein [Candidatus Binatia bacterium]